MSELVSRNADRRLRDRDDGRSRALIAHRDRVFNITYRMLGNRAEAEDVAQEVFITVFKTIDTFREEVEVLDLALPGRGQPLQEPDQVPRAPPRARPRRARRDAAGRSATNGAIGTQPRSAPDRALEGAQIEQVLEAAIASLDEDQRVRRRAARRRGSVDRGDLRDHRAARRHGEVAPAPRAARPAQEAPARARVIRPG